MKNPLNPIKNLLNYQRVDIFLGHESDMKRVETSIASFQEAP